MARSRASNACCRQVSLAWAPPARETPLLRDPPLTDLLEAPSHLAHDGELGLRDGRPLPRPVAGLRALLGVEGALLPRLAVFEEVGGPTNQPSGFASWISSQAASRSITVLISGPRGEAVGGTGDLWTVLADTRAMREQLPKASNYEVGQWRRRKRATRTGSKA